MKLLLSVCLFFLMACSAKKQIHLDDPLTSGREFIEASLKGNYDDAKKYLVQDSTNISSLRTMEEFYAKMTPEEKKGYQNANIIINPTDNISDSEMIINYTNTFKKVPSKLKMKRINNEWRIDFKYIFTGDQ